jgi:hypothetical protein
MDMRRGMIIIGAVFLVASGAVVVRRAAAQQRLE